MGLCPNPIAPRCGNLGRNHSLPFQGIIINQSSSREKRLEILTGNTAVKVSQREQDLNSEYKLYLIPWLTSNSRMCRGNLGVLVKKETDPRRNFLLKVELYRRWGLWICLLFLFPSECISQPHTGWVTKHWRLTGMKHHRTDPKAYRAAGNSVETCRNQKPQEGWSPN